MTGHAAADHGRDRPIGADERTGVLHPRNLDRYQARWFEPDAAVRDVVDHYWQVTWRLEDGEAIPQRIIDLPAITLTIEEGDVPAPLVATGVHRRAWQRRITGTGSVFGIRLRPAGLRVVSDLEPTRLADATLAVTRELDRRLHELLTDIGTYATPDERVRAADAALRVRSAARPATSDALLANTVLDELRSRVHARTGPSLAQTFDVSERTLQRALSTTLGRGPKWVSRRIRLQEVARVLADEAADPDLASLAHALGYTDQAHLTRDFREVAGITPGAYRRELSAPTARVAPDG